MKVWRETELSNEKYSNVVLFKVNILLELMNSLAADKVKVDGWKVWCEAVIYKLCYHISSMINLYHGTEIPFLHNDKNMKIFDDASIIILFRSILENQLTFFYLYGNSETEQEKYFRVLVWRYCGIKQRTEFEIDTTAAKQKQDSEKILLATLKTEIEDHPLYQLYNPDQKKKIIKGRNPRLFESWKSLIEKSGLITSMFNNIYVYKSNYSHTEFISVLQLAEGNLGFVPEGRKNHNALFFTHCLVCKTIFELIEFFPSMKPIYEAKEEVLKKEIESLARICTAKNQDFIESFKPKA